jgi:hypothetical protein
MIAAASAAHSSRTVKIVKARCTGSRISRSKNLRSSPKATSSSGMIWLTWAKYSGFTAPTQSASTGPVKPSRLATSVASEIDLTADRSSP